MDYKEIIYEKEGEIARITLNMPEKLNPMGQLMLDEIRNALEEAKEDEDIKVVIFRGAGRAFSSGHKLEDLAMWYGWSTEKKKRPETQEFKLRRDERMSQLWHYIYYFPKTTIAQVHGICAGSGLSLAIVTDLTIASEDAEFSHVENRMGHGGPTYVLPYEIMLIGPKKTRELSLTTKVIDAREAERIGLVNYVVPRDKLDEEVDKLAKTICLEPADGLAAGKVYMRQVMDAFGLSTAYASGYVHHTIFNNMRLKPGEFNFFKAGAEAGGGMRGLLNAQHTRATQYEALGVKGFSKKK